MIDFANEVLGMPLYPWQEWTVVHMGELLPDGRPRFRKILILVARQNGKTHLLVTLSLFWMFVDKVEMVLGTSTKLDYAAESWKKATRLAKRVPELYAEISHKDAVRKANGEQVLWRADELEHELEEGSRYKIAASNEEGGRSLTIDRLVLDELRHHYDYSAYDACVPATNAVRHAQIVGISNAGTVRSEVLNDWRAEALTFIKTGEGDKRLGLIEYSTPEDANPLDLHALAQANPTLGQPMDPDALLGEAKTAVSRGGKKLAGFKTEVMCINVPVLDPAVDGETWTTPHEQGGCLDVGTMDDLRDRLAGVVDVAPDGLHAALVVAGVMDDGRVRVEVAEAWSGPDALKRMRAELPDLVTRVKPKKLGWFPSGPAAAIGADLTADREDDDPRGPVWPPPNVEIAAIRTDVPGVCMGFASLVSTGDIAQNGDQLLKDHITGAQKLTVGEAQWRFGRKGEHCNAAYAAAGAVHLARTLPIEKPPPKSQVF